MKQRRVVELILRQYEAVGELQYNKKSSLLGYFKSDLKTSSVKVFKLSLPALDKISQEFLLDFKSRNIDDFLGTSASELDSLYIVLDPGNLVIVGMLSVKEVPAPEVKVLVEAIWVKDEYRRNGIALWLLKCVQESHLMNTALKKDDILFSETTVKGKLLERAFRATI